MAAEAIITDHAAAAQTPPADSQCQRCALAALSLCMLLSSLGTSIANVSLPTLAQVLHVSFQSVQWVVLTYLITVTALTVAAGRLGDLVGRRRLLLLGILLFTAASALCGASAGLGSLVAARALQGAGAAVLLALSVALVREAVPPEKTGGAMGLLGTMSAVGTAMGPSIGGLMIDNFGWRALFLVNVPLGFAAWLLATRGLPEDLPRPDRRPVNFDMAGTLLLAAALVAYALAMTLGRGDFTPRNGALLFAAFLLAAAFIRAERGARAPLVDFAMAREPVLRASLLMSMLVSTVMMATLVVGPFYLTQALELDPARVGFVLSAGPLAVAMSGVPAGRLVDRFGPIGMTFIGLVAMAVGLLFLALAPRACSIPGYIVPIVVVTIGYGFFQTANNTIVMHDIHPQRRGLLAGILSLSRNLGLITGASVMGAVFAFAAGSRDLQLADGESVARAMRVTFGLSAALIALAISIATVNVREPRS